MIEKQIEYIRSITDFKPDIAITLGSGLATVAENIDKICEIPYKDIPNHPVSTAPGHNGKYIFGYIDNKPVVALQGRVHLYEGYNSKEVTNSIRIMKRLGVKKLILTNASGGINSDFKPGDFMIINDHISSFIDSPLIGANDDSLGVRFPDMSQVYSKAIINVIKSCAKKLNIDVKEGVYIQFKGPAFETPAEVRMAKAIGANAVGMSTAIEAQAATHCGIEVGAISLISNLACGISSSPITSQEVIEAGDKAGPIFSKLINEVIKSL